MTSSCRLVAHALVTHHGDAHFPMSAGSSRLVTVQMPLASPDWREQQRRRAFDIDLVNPVRSPSAARAV
jgi:hypothetical protein